MSYTLLEGEEFRPIEGADGYSISNYGRVLRESTQRIMTGRKDKRGYMVLSIKNKRLKFNRTIHRAVALAFIPNTYNKPSINHKDSDKANNHIDNLEWCTPKENTQHAILAGRINIEGTIVLDVNTGVYYNSIKEALRYCDYKRTKFKYSIKKSSFRYVIV